MSKPETAVLSIQKASLIQKTPKCKIQGVSKRNHLTLQKTGNAIYDSKVARFNGWFLENHSGQTGINFSHIVEFLEHLKSIGFLPNTLASYRCALKKSIRLSLPAAQNLQFLSMLNQAFREAKISQPQRVINPEIECLTEEEIRKLIKGTAQENYPLSLLMKFLYITASRITEALSARVQNVRIQGKEVIIRYTETKTNKECFKRIPVFLYRQIQKEFGGTLYLFEHQGKKYTARNFNYLFSKYGRKILDRDISSHIFRKSSATNLLRNHKADIQKIRQHLNHSDIRTTLQSYAFSSLEYADIKKLVRAVG